MFEESPKKTGYNLRLNAESYDALTAYKERLEKQIGMPLKYPQVLIYLINQVKDSK